MPARPTSITVFGVLNILFGILGLIGGAFSLAMMFFPMDPALAAQNPMLRAQQNPLFDGWTKLNLAVGLASCVVVIIGGVGLLKMRPWGRTCSVIYATYAIISTVIGMAMMWAFIMQPMLDQLKGKPGPIETAAIFGGSMIGGCIGLAYPVLLLYFMTRRDIVARFVGDATMLGFDERPAETLLRSGDAAGSNNPYLSPLTESMPGVGNSTSAAESVVEAFVPAKNGAALASYYLGLFSLFPCLGFPLGVAAVYFGIQGLRNVRRDPSVRGGAHAWVGLVCGALFGLFNFVLIVLAIGAMLFAGR